MSSYALNKINNTYNRSVIAHPLHDKIQIAPQKSMVMFDLDGTLIREGIFLNKVLDHVSKESISKALGLNNKYDPVPVSEFVNVISQGISNKLEHYIQAHNSNLEDIEKNFINVMKPIIKKSLMLQNAQIILSPEDCQQMAHVATDKIKELLFKDELIKPLFKKGISLYNEQIDENNIKTITPEAVKMLNSLANLGVPVAIVSNGTQAHVNKAFDIILEKLSPETQKKYHDKNWYFAKRGLERDEDGDLIRAAKPSPDLLIASHDKAKKFNIKNQRDDITDVVFVGNSEHFDMRAADNLQRSLYGEENNLHVYKLLCRYDKPIKAVNDKKMIDNDAVLFSIADIDKRLQTVFKQLQ